VLEAGPGAQDRIGRAGAGQHGVEHSAERLDAGAAQICL
jgi:hypothetical protein